MNNLREKIRNRCNWLIVKILFIGLTVWLLLEASRIESVREASILYKAGAQDAVVMAASETEETELETESSSERQSEALTPAELAMLADDPGSGGNGTKSVEEASAAETQEPGENVLLSGIEHFYPMLVDFRIPMAMPGPLQEQKSGRFTELWTVETELEEETAAEPDVAVTTREKETEAEPSAVVTTREKETEAELSVVVTAREEETATEPSVVVTAREEETEAEPSVVVSARGEGNRATAQYKIVEYQDGLTFHQWKLVSEKYKFVSAGEVPPFELLKKMVENRVDSYDGDWSVYVKNLKTDESFVVNDRPMKSASVMKLFIMGTVYKAIEAGKLDRTDEVVSLLNSMITASDNEASNRLLYLLGNSSYADGIAQVDAFIREYGFSDMTVEYNGFNNSDTVISPAHNNQVAAKDCGKLLEDIYRRTWLNRAAANEAEQLMLNQNTRYKIPAGLPEGVSCGNKTGEMETTENDAAIVYAKDCDYILVVLSSDWNSKDQAISRIASMSEMVYEFLN